MTAHAVSWAYAQTTVPPSARAVLANLAHRFNAKTLQCWPSQARMCADTGLSRATLNRALTLLERRGIIARLRRNGCRTRYTLPGFLATLEREDSVKPVSPCDIRKQREETAQSKSKSLKAVPAKPAPATITIITTGAPGVLHAAGALLKGVAMKAHDVLAKHKAKAALSDAEILAIPKFKGGKVPASAAVRVWSRAHAKYFPGEFMSPLTLAQEGMLGGAVRRVGPDYYGRAVLAAMQDWPGFTSQAKADAAAFNVPVRPSVNFFVKFLEAAVNYALREEKAAAEAAAFKAQKPVVQSFAKKEQALAAFNAPAPEVLSKDDLESLLEGDDT